ncbi:hypothetical protein [Treponema denticola]|nr:hypothetical protein [Treponema denticola]
MLKKFNRRRNKKSAIKQVMPRILCGIRLKYIPALEGEDVYEKEK